MIDPLQDVGGPAGPIPNRPPMSIRRTSTIDMTWPDGFGTQLQLHGRGRDAFTDRPEDPPTAVAAADTITGIGPDRSIVSIEATPRDGRLDRLIGCRGGGHLRAALDEFLPGERQAGTLLHLLLDDISGTSLVAGVAWSRWDEDPWRESAQKRGPAQMEGVCIGFRPGSHALVEIGQRHQSLRAQPVGPLLQHDDPFGWHELPTLPDVSTRRSRFIDVSLDGGVVVIDAGFQDSVGDPEHGRVAIHEYRVHATADASTLTVTSLHPDARVLPFRECPSAVETAKAVVGAMLPDFREVVLDRLAGTSGCTHLNDALRGLADVPALLAGLQASIR